MRISLIILFNLLTIFSWGQEISVREVIRIPVVIHILYENEEQNISDEQVNLQLESLNKDFSRANDNYESTPEFFKSFSADMEIQFCLASIDENGNSSSGITRTETVINEIGLTEFYFKSDEGGHNPWNVEKYVNIWVADFGDSEILGVTPLAGEASPPEKDGILVNYKYFGVEGNHQDESRKKGKVLTHEMGHYFGLKHIWGSLNTMCSDDDDITDTPLQNEPTFGCPSFPSPDICTQGNGIMYCNFMDYTDDECLTMFTQDQKSKVIEVINNIRSSLIESGNSMCVNNNLGYSDINFLFYPNPAHNEVIVEFNTSNEDRTISLYDINGRLVLLAEAKKERNIIQINKLQNGLYYLKTGQTVKKMIVMK